MVLFPPNGTLYRHAFDTWHCYIPSSEHSTRHRTFSRSNLTDVPPAPLLRATAWVDHLGRAHFEGAAADAIHVPPPPATIHHLIRTWPNSWPLERSFFPPLPAQLIRAIEEGRAHGACDGSYMPKLATDLGAASWKIEDPQSRQAMQGTVQTSGLATDVDSYRSELQGVHAMLLGLLAFCTFHHITEGSVKLGCDNLGYVRHGQHDWRKVPLSIAHVDLVRAIRVIKSKLPIKVHFVHIYGHQDDRLSFDNLPRLAQLNVEMDQIAKDQLVELYDFPPATPCSSAIAHEGWHCTVNGAKLTTHPAKALRRAVFGTKLSTFLSDRQRLTRLAFLDIDWDAMETATDLFPPLYRLWVSKHVSGFFGTGTMMKNWDFWDHSRCPCCDHAREDKIHLLTCPHPTSNDTWQESLLGLEAWMIDTDTDETIRECILLSLETRDPNQTFTAYSNQRSFQAAQAQDRIGWMNTTEGKLSHHWRQLQAEHYKAIDSPRSASKWAAGLVTNLLGITHSQWLHRCAVLHERDIQGLKLKDSQQLAAAIQEQFLLGLEGLQARDRHFITRGQATVNALPADNKQAWLSGIRIARQLYHDSETREIDGMRTFMLQWLSAPD